MKSHFYFYLFFLLIFSSPFNNSHQGDNGNVITHDAIDRLFWSVPAGTWFIYYLLYYILFILKKYYLHFVKMFLSWSNNIYLFISFFWCLIFYNYNICNLATSFLLSLILSLANPSYFFPFREMSFYHWLIEAYI